MSQTEIKIISDVLISNNTSFIKDLIEESDKEIVIKECARYCWQNSKEEQFYTKGCLWSPDNTCILTAVNLDGMHVFEIPSNLENVSGNENDKEIFLLENAIHIKEGGTVYDYCWYPFMNSNLPETCCWIATRQHEPIHLWDAYTGELRCSYRGYDSVDEVECAISLIFSFDGSKILGGYKKSIKIFDVNIPGRDYDEISTKQSVSCFAINDLHEGLIATGSWKNSINIYDLRSPSLGCLFSLNKHIAGVTYLKFSKNGNSLFSGARKDNQLIEWDMRNLPKYKKILKRNVQTNQRIYFDLNPSNNWLVSGDTTGLVHLWDLNDNYKDYAFKVGNDCCNGVNFNPSKSILATTSGQYHFLNEEESSGKLIKMYENSLVFWYVDGVDIS